jgi:hypothetical protein
MLCAFVANFLFAIRFWKTRFTLHFVCLFSASGQTPLSCLHLRTRKISAAAAKKHPTRSRPQGQKRNGDMILSDCRARVSRLLAEFLPIC